MATPTLSGMTVEELNVNGLRIQKDILFGNQPINALLAIFNEINGQFAPQAPDAGDQLFPVEIGDHSVPTELITGYEPIDLNVRQTLDQQMQYQFWFATYPIVISMVEQAKNQGPERMQDLQKSRVGNVQRAGLRNMEKQILQGAVAGHTRLLTLNGVDVTAGLLEAAAPASQTHTIGGFARATYAAYPFLGNQYYNCGGSVNSNGVEAIEQIQAQIKVSAFEPDVAAGWVASQNARGAFGKLGKAHVIIDSSKKEWDLAMPDIMIAGARIKTSPYMPLTGATSTTTKCSMYRVSPKHTPIVYVKGFAWQLGDWVEAQGTKTLVAQLDCIAQIMPGSDRAGGNGVMATSALITNAEAY